MPRYNLTFRLKRKIVEESKRKEPKILAKKYGLNVSTVYKYMRNREQLFASKQLVNDKLTKVCPKSIDFDNSVLDFIKNSYMDGFPLSNTMLLTHAEQIAKQIYGVQQEVTQSWLKSFKLLYNITDFKVCGEYLSCDLIAANDIPRILKAATTNHIFNMDEIRLFWKKLPTKTIAKKGSKVHGVKFDKSAYTIAFFVSMDGEELTPTVIGHHANPRCFENKKIPVSYYSNKSAWMTKDIYSEIIFKLHKHLVEYQERIISIADNFSGHDIDTKPYPRIQFEFSPPNTTSKVHPLDQGVINSFKKLYTSEVMVHIYKHYLREKTMLGVEKSSPCTTRWFGSIELGPESIVQIFETVGIMPVTKKVKKNH